MSAIKRWVIDTLDVSVYQDRRIMGQTAATELAVLIKQLLKKRSEINMVFAAAPSQNEFLETLANAHGLDWTRINGFHMDEYIGLNHDAPQGFGNFLRGRIFSKLPFKSVHYLNGNCLDLEFECQRYSSLLRKHPVQIVCAGIGENGHLAFNDPGVADFDDPHLVKVVELDLKCRQQQVNDGCFSELSMVPKKALTLTIPALLAAEYIFCIVPEFTKAIAVKETLTGPIDQSCPATILRRHSKTRLYLDQNSAYHLLSNF